MESFEPMVTKLCSGQEILYKINQRRIIQKRNKVELRFLCTALRVIARSMHTVNSAYNGSAYKELSVIKN